MIEIREVKTKKEQKMFIDFPLNLYKGNPNFVPPLYGDEKALFKADYMYYEQSKAVYYLAYMDGKVVGRISGILQYASNEKWKQKRVRFTRFDSIDNQEVANALFDAVKNWALSEGMDAIVGPLGFSDLEREGLLIEGFDQLATFEEQYNFPYYQKLIENYGFVKEVDWEERMLRNKPNRDERLKKLCESIMKKHKLRFGEAKSTKEFLKKYADQFFEILDITYDGLYQTVPISKKARKALCDNFELIVNPKHVTVILDENDKVVCFGLCMPSIAKAVQKSNGKLTLGCILRILKAVKKPEVIDLALIGVLPEYQNKGIATILIVKIMEMLDDPNLDHCETNLNLETNHAIINQWKNFEATMHKKRRSYVLEIK